MALEYPELLPHEHVVLPATGHRTRARTLCLFVPVTARRGLSRALLLNLAEEMPEVDFTLDRRARADSVWICGYGRGVERLVRQVRREHPGALVLVTGRGTGGGWRRRVVACGADHAIEWPVPYGLLAGILRGLEPCSGAR